MSEHYWLKLIIIDLQVMLCNIVFKQIKAITLKVFLLKQYIEFINSTRRFEIFSVNILKELKFITELVSKSLTSNIDNEAQAPNIAVIFVTSDVSKLPLKFISIKLKK